VAPSIINQNAKSVPLLRCLFESFAKKAFYGNKAKFFGAKIAPFKKGKKRAKSFDHAKVP
jgi:hypothetical protein